MQSIEKLIRNIPDFPKPGINFKDITPVLADPVALKKTIEWFILSIEAAGGADVIAGIESRGFMFGVPIAEKMGLGFIPIRKPGKLPFATHRESYELEYGTDSLEIHTDAVSQGQRVALVDDLLATGGTATAAVKLIEKAGGEITCATFLIELDFLEGRKKMSTDDSKLFSFLHY